MPPGDYNLNATLGLIETTANQPIILQGAGRGATRFIIQHTNHWVRLGDRAAAVESKNIEIRDCTFLGNVAQDSAHAAFVCEKISLYRLRNVEIVGAAADFLSAIPTLQTMQSKGMIDCLYASGGTSGTYRVNLHSESILVITDTCKFNGNRVGNGLFAQTNPGINFDGAAIGNSPGVSALLSTGSRLRCRRPRNRAFR